MKRTTSLMIKRAFDVFVSLSGLVFLSPALIVIAAINLRIHGRPILFSQVRPGRDAELFRIYKFRSMTSKRDSKGDLLEDSMRRTKFGDLLRATSLDELPELWNVLKGDMSIVGPRPLLPEYLQHYSKHQMRRHELRPGITGLAQTQGRNELDWETKFDLDVKYVDERTLLLDLQILFKTLVAVFKREGIDPIDGGSMPKFGE